MKFKFKLQKVLQHRKVLENLAQAELSEALMLLAKAEEELVSMLADVYSSENRRHQILTQPSQKALSGFSPIEQLQQIDFFLKGQEIKIQHQRMKVEDIKKTVEIRREILRNKSQDVKIIDKLKEKQKAEFISEYEKVEQAEMDERASLRHGLRKNGVG